MNDLGFTLVSKLGIHTRSDLVIKQLNQFKNYLKISIIYGVI